MAKVTIVPNDEFDDKSKVVRGARIQNLTRELAAKRKERDELIRRFMGQNPAMTLKEAAEKFGVNYLMIWRIKNGVEE